MTEGLSVEVRVEARCPSPHAYLALDVLQQLRLAPLEVRVGPLARARLSEGVVVERAHPARVLRVTEVARQDVLRQPLRVAYQDFSTVR